MGWGSKKPDDNLSVLASCAAHFENSQIRDGCSICQFFKIPRVERTRTEHIQHMKDMHAQYIPHIREEVKRRKEKIIGDLLQQDVVLA